MSGYQNRGLPIFTGVVVYVHDYDSPDQQARSTDIYTLKNHGAVIAANCDYYTTHIICNHSAPTVKVPVDRASHIASITQKQHLNVADLVCRYSFGGSAGKIVLRREWIDDCVFRGRWLGGTEQWGGWAVAGVASCDAELAESAVLLDRYTAPVSRPDYGELGRPFNHPGPRTTSATTTEPTTPPPPYRSSTANSVDIAILEKEEATEKDSAPQLVNIDFHETLDESCRANDLATSAVANTGLAEKLELLAGKLDWAPAIFKTSSTRLHVWIEEGLETRASLSATIEIIGGGKMTSKESATHILLALPPQAQVPPADLQHLRPWLKQGRDRHVLSFQWAIDCFIHQSWIDERPYCLVSDVVSPLLEDLPADEYDRFLRVFRIAKSTSDLPTALRVVANSVGTRSIDYWQTFYTQNSSRIDAQLACKVSASTAPNVTRKKSRPVNEIESSCENDVVCCSEPSGTDEDTPMIVELKAKEQAMPSNVGTRWLEVAQSSRMLERVEDDHKARFLELAGHLAQWDRSRSISTFLVGLPRVFGIGWSTIYWKYRHLFDTADDRVSRAKEASPIPVPAPSISVESSLSPAPCPRQHPSADGKTYFTRSNMQPLKSAMKKAKVPKLPPTQQSIAERRKKQDIVRGLSQAEAENYLWYAAGHAKQSWQEIACGYVTQTTSTLRYATAYLTWNTRFGYNETEVKVQAVITAARDSHRSLKWRNNSTCEGCQGTSGDLSTVERIRLCFDCRIDWNRGGTEQQRKRGLKTRRSDVRDWKKKLGRDQ